MNSVSMSEPSSFMSPPQAAKPGPLAHVEDVLPLSPAFSLKGALTQSPVHAKTHTASTTSVPSDTAAMDGIIRSSMKRPRSLALAALVDDFVDENAVHGRVWAGDEDDPFDGCLSLDLDSLLTVARPSDSVSVCASIYLARADANGLPLSADNASALVAAALAMASRAVDRVNSSLAITRLSAAAGLQSNDVEAFTEVFSEFLPLPEGAYISPATFREFEELLDGLL